MLSTEFLGFPKAHKISYKGAVDADSSHLQSTCVDWKMMTWTFCVCSTGLLQCDDCCLHHSIEAVLCPASSPDSSESAEFFML